MSVVTLESVFLSFQQWRSERSSRAEPIPANLWQMAMSLYPQHKISHICQRLGLSGSQLRQRIEASSGGSSDGGFVLAATDIDRPIPKPASEVELGLEGCQRRLTVKVSIDALSQVLPHIEALL